MWKHQICLGISGQFGLSNEEQIPLFKKIGFDGFFSGWQKDKLYKLRKLADANGMLYQSVHAPFTNSAKLWDPDPSVSRPAVDELCACAEETAAVGVGIMVAHTFIGFDKHEPNEVGVENYRRVAEHAASLGIKVAFENTEGIEYLHAVMAGTADMDNVGFCWDTGHEMCYNHSEDMLALYGSRLIATHINDNLGIRDFCGRITFIDDLHLLPFDGIANWQGIAARLDREGFNGPLTFELNRQSKPGRRENDIYQKLSPEEYLTEAYKRACRVAALRIS